jgi:IMP and pyridine-specific 5'-nucleotidase
LKEQDEFISFIMSMHKTHSCEEVFAKMQRWVAEHRKDPRRSKLKQLVPSVGAIFTELPLAAAFHEFDSFFALSRRRFVLPNFAEIRHGYTTCNCFFFSLSSELHVCSDEGRIFPVAT